MTTNNLTEQWKKGELKDGDYYVKTRQGIIIIDYFDVDEFSFDTNHYVEEILAEVPDYIEWKNYVNGYCDEHEYNLKLSEENRQLKELLKECREVLNKTAYTYKFDMVAKINEVL